MEDVLDVYSQQSTVGEKPLVRVCFDERPCQLIDEVMTPLPVKPGRSQKQDYEYERKGTACLLLAYDLDTGQRYAQVREQHTKQDYAQFMDWLVKEYYPQADKIHLVQDNLNTHQAGSFYEYLSLERAYELKNKFVFHYTPIHASWLNLVEIEFSALARQCLDRRIATIDTLRREVLAWMKERNDQQVKIHWLFDTPKARTKLQRHYLKVNPANETMVNSDNNTIVDSNN